MSFKSVVIIGAGPLGLMAAIEAKQNFVNDVTIIEKRSGYTRLNVPSLDNPLTNHLKKIDVADSIWKTGVSKVGDSVGFSKIEEGLFAKATSMGIKVERGWTVVALAGEKKNAQGRYTLISLMLLKWNEGERKVSYTHPSKMLQTDFLIVSTGGAAAADPVVTDTLGFHFHKLAPTDFGAYGIFTPLRRDEAPQELSPEESMQFYAQKNEKQRLANSVSGRRIGFETQDHNYLLATLRNCSAADFKKLQADQQQFRQVLMALGQAEGRVVLNEIKDVQKNMALFEIAIQRAQQFYSPEYPAVLLGDAAVTPHPEQGSGITTGFHGFEKLQELFAALKTLDSSDDTEHAFGSFNNAVEIIASKKALEGTRGVLQNHIATINNYIKLLQNELPGIQSAGARNYVTYIINELEPLRDDLQTESNLCKTYLDAIQNGGLSNSVLSIENLWKVIRQTHDQIQTMIKDADLMGENLEKIRAKFA